MLFRTYRDKFIAHLDDRNTMNILRMGLARRSTKFLHQRLLDQETATDTFDDAPKSAKELYDRFVNEGLEVYK